MSSEAGFRMTVEDVFTIRGRGTVVTGRIEQGRLSVGDTVQLTRAGAATKTAEVAGIEMFQKTVKEAAIGDNVGVLLRNVGRDDVRRGDVLAGPGSAGPGSEFVWKE